MAQNAELPPVQTLAEFETKRHPELAGVWATLLSGAVQKGEVRRKRWLSNQMMTGLGRFFTCKSKVCLSFLKGFKSGTDLPLSNFAMKSVAN